MFFDEFVQDVPELCDLIIKNDIIYLKKHARLKRGCEVINNQISKDELINEYELKGRTPGTPPNALKSFLNCCDAQKWVKFIAEFGFVDDRRQSKTHYCVEQAEVINGYIPVASLNEYKDLQHYFISLKEWLPLVKLYTDGPPDKFLGNWNSFKSEEIEPMIDYFIDEINKYCTAVSVRVKFDCKLGFVSYVHYPSLRHALYYLLRSDITGVRPLVQCKREGCSEWFESKKGKQYCCRECAEKVQQEIKRTALKKDPKEAVYKKIKAHFYDSYFERRKSHLKDGFNYDNWQSGMLKLKRNSQDFFTEADNICKESCSRSLIFRSFCIFAISFSAASRLARPSA